MAAQTHEAIQVPDFQPEPLFGERTAEIFGIEHLRVPTGVEQARKHFLHVGPIEALFGPDGVRKIVESRRGVSLENLQVFEAFWENPWAKAGGVVAVAQHLPSALRGVCKDVFRITPHHDHLQTAPAASELKRRALFVVPFGDQEIETSLFEVEKDGESWFLLSASGMFEADGGRQGTDPYLYSFESQEDRDGEDSLVLRDALFFAKALPLALEALGKTQDVMVHAHDWQTQISSLTVKEAIIDDVLQTASVVMTSHNPYDHYLPAKKLALITHRVKPHHWPEFWRQERETVSSRMIPLSDAPMATVSVPFAAELTRDPLQTDFFAPHLTSIYEGHGLLGIRNGLFMKPEIPFSEAALNEASNLSDSNRFQRILAEKEAKRAAALEVLESYRPPEVIGRLSNSRGGDLRELDPNTPLFMMFGRPDPRQKGFQTLIRAFRQAFPKGGAKLALAAPFTSRDPLSRELLSDLSTYVEDPDMYGDAVLYPIKMEQGYMEVMAGASALVFPSRYEPFGAATEPGLKGTPVVARATGGLLTQVVPPEEDRDLCTGLLIRERPVPGRNIGAEWIKIQTALSPAEESKVELNHELVSSLGAGLARMGAAYRHRNAPNALYPQMLKNVGAKALSLGWEQVAAEHRAWFEHAIKQ